jgi:RNA polymerase sigma-B factor
MRSVQIPLHSDSPPAPASARARRTDDLVAELAGCPSDERREALLEELIAVNMSVADSIVSRYRCRGIANEDLQQVAYLALTKAARRFDPQAGHDFLSFCVPTVRGEVRRHFRDHGWMVRPPRRIQELQQRISRGQEDLTVRRGRPPSADELAHELDESVDDVREAMDRQGCFTPASLDRPVGEDDGTPLGELLGEQDEGQRAAEARVVLAPVVRRLGERDRRILSLRYFEGLTQREIAEDIGVTQMQVSRLLTRILRTLREDLGPLDERADVTPTGDPAATSG